MNSITSRLARCFQIVFPNLDEAEAPAATQASLAQWDSIAMVTLLNVIEEEFGVQLDLEMLAEYDSFARIEDALRSAAL